MTALSLWHRLPFLAELGDSGHPENAPNQFRELLDSRTWPNQ
jgi:hypothetical protein